MIGGGAHAANSTEIQEFLIVPGDAADAEEAVFANAAVHRTVKELLKKQGKAAGKGDEGAWAPQIDDALAFELIAEATTIVADEMNIKVDMGIDVAASQMWNGEAYQYRQKVRFDRRPGRLHRRAAWTSTTLSMWKTPSTRTTSTHSRNSTARWATAAWSAGTTSSSRRSTASCRASRRTPQTAC